MYLYLTYILVSLKPIADIKPSCQNVVNLYFDARLILQHAVTTEVYILSYSKLTLNNTL